VSDVGAVLGRLAGRTVQQAFVVDDIVTAKASMERSFGPQQWFEFESTAPWVWQGREVRCDLQMAFGQSGGAMIELIQPLAGEGVHFEFLRDRGPGAHHLGFFLAPDGDLDEQIELAAADGFPPVMQGALGGARFCYLDTVAQLGVYIEIISDPQGMMFKMMPWWRPS